MMHCVSVLVCLAILVSVACAEELRVASWNIRFDAGGREDAPAGAERPWDQRRERIIDALLWERPDVFGCQEVLHNQLVDLRHGLSAHYDHVGVGRNDGKTAGEAVPIFWDRSQFALQDVWHHWLSPNGSIGSIGWDASQTRMITIVRLISLVDGSSIVVANTHFDDQGVRARTESARLVLQLLENEMKKETVILLGDLNSERDEDAYRTLTGHPAPQLVFGSATTFLDTALELKSTFGETHTFTDFVRKGAERPKVIDCA